MDLGVLLQAALLIEASPANVTPVWFLPRVNPFVSLQVTGTFKTFAAVRTDEALLKHQPLHRPPAHSVVQVTVLTVAQQPAAERTGLESDGAAAARHSESGIDGGFRETRQGVVSYV